MIKALISEVQTEKLIELVESLENERDAIENTITKIQNEIYFRQNPELKNTNLDFYVEIY